MLYILISTTLLQGDILEKKCIAILTIFLESIYVKDF